MRPHVAAIYAFARLADDFADEGDVDASIRLARLDEWRRRLHAAAAGPPGETADETTTAVFTAIHDTLGRRHLDLQLFDDLLSAFRQDVTTPRYATWDALVDYCRRSANPIGRLMLALAGRTDPPALSASDALCTALQLTNFWQDLERDWAKGRVYVPTAILSAHGAVAEDLAAGQLTPSWRSALGDVAARTRALFETGRPVTEAVSGRLRWELRATWLGGHRILDRIEAADFDVFKARPSLGWRDAVPIAWGIMTYSTSATDPLRSTGAGATR
jgi:squalene synthase HpnC